VPEEKKTGMNQQKQSLYKAHLAVLGTNIFFASNFSLVKLISPALIGPFGLNVVRAAISTILFWVVWLFGKTSIGIDKKDWVRFFFCALTGVTINQLLFLKGLTLTTTIHAALLMLVTPIVVTLFALWILKERFTLFKAIGLSLGIGGATFLILQREAGQHAANYLLGDLLIIINAISYSIYFILVKPLMERYSPLQVIRWVFTLGFLMILPVGWQQAESAQWELFEIQHFLALFSVSVLGTFLAYYFNIYGIQRLGASVTGSYIYTQPVFAVLIAIVFLNEQITWQKMLAAVLIFTGVFLVNKKQKSQSS
jgi:drug/metabolite transporter (DMT)-like permease